MAEPPKQPATPLAPAADGTHPGDPRRAEAERQRLFELSPDLLCVANFNGWLEQVNPAWTLCLGWSAEELTSRPMDEFMVPEDLDSSRSIRIKVKQGEAVRGFENRYRAKDGSFRWLSWNVHPSSDDGRIFAVARDITLQKLAEQKLHRLNRLYAVSSSINETIVREQDTTELYRQACRIAVERGGLVMAWVGLTEPDSDRIAPVAHWGDQSSYIASISLNTNPDSAGGRGPAGQAFRSGRPAVCNDIAAEAANFFYKAEALSFNYRSCAAFALTVETRAIGVLAVYGDQPNYFGEEEINLLAALAANLSFAVESHQRERDRKRAEAALRESEQRFRQLAENSKETFWIRDLDTQRVLYVSPSYERMWGLSCESLYQDPNSWLEAIHRDDRAAVVEGTAPVHGGHDITYRIIRPDGAVRWIHARASPVKDVSGRIYREVGSADDITERKLADEKLRDQATLLDEAQDAILVCDLELRILYWNRSAERLYGWAADDAVGNSVKVLLHRNSPAFIAATRCVLEQSEWVGEIEQWTRDGKSLVVEGRWTLVRDEFEQPRSILAIHTDITRRKQLEQQFFRAQRMESIGTLASGIAHDLNNALAPILMSTDLLDLTVTDARSREILGMIRSSAQRGADMVRQVLSFARGVEGKRVSVEIATLIEELRKITADTFDKSVRVDVEVQPDAWELDADPTQLHQVLLNLCMNARDAMPGGGVIGLRVVNEVLDATTAALHLEASSGPYLRLEVEDQGTGIPQEIIDQIFDPFFTTKGVGQGTGLGLSTAQAIIKSHGGFIEVFSRPEMGSRFTIYLPAGSGQKVVLPPSEPRVQPCGHGETILLVDDESSVRHVTRQVLEAYGYHVITAADGAQGLQRFAADPDAIDAVITDLMMPIMDGREMIRELRKLRPEVPIIATSGVADDERSGPVDVLLLLAKPYSIETLLVALAESLSR